MYIENVIYVLSGEEEGREEKRTHIYSKYYIGVSCMFSHLVLPTS